MRAGIILFAGVMLAGVSAASAQVRWGSPAVPRVGACFYEHADFRGRSFCAGTGQSLPALPGDMRNKISSIRILGRAQVIVFKDDRFRGSSARFNTDVRNLEREGWNDVISSVRVESDAIGWGARPPVWGRPAPPREGACFYQDPDYRGQYFCMPRGATYLQVPQGFNDKISSIRVFRAGVMIFVDREFGGRAQRVTSDVPRLRGFWDDRISSIRVY